MKIKDRVGGTVLASTEAADNPLNVITITIDNALKTITRKILATATDDFTFRTGVYDVEAVSPTGDVTLMLFGAVKLTKEVTT